MEKVTNWIGDLVANNAVGFALGTIFGMWLLVVADCLIRGVCR